MADILNIYQRQQVISEILGAENRSRKAESLKRFEVYMDRARDYVMDQLRQEFSAKTVSQMRTMTSISLCRRIIDEQASIYKTEPMRTFSSERELTEQEIAQLNAIYDEGKFNVFLKKSNKMFKLHRQCAIQVIPKDGKICLRVLQPHHYDVVPNEYNPEKADAYVISSYDKSLEMPVSISSPGYYSQQLNDFSNQRIADPNDYRNKLASAKFVWWSDEFSFVTDGHGYILDDAGNKLENADPSYIANPIGEMPFIDVSEPKDFEFWVRSGSPTVQFTIDFQILLSDIATINRMQGYAQAIIYSETVPENMVVGPNNVLHIPLDPNKETQPRFEFASPNPNLQASLDLLNQSVSLFLTSNGIDPKTISGKAEANKYSSGLERLLAMIERFEATKDDVDLFKWVESKVCDLSTKWSNLFQPVTQANGNTMPLEDELRLATLPDDVDVMVNYARPENVQTKIESEDSVIKRIENGLISRAEGISELRGIDEATASLVVKKIDQEAMLLNVDRDQENAN